MHAVACNQTSPHSTLTPVLCNRSIRYAETAGTLVNEALLLARTMSHYRGATLDFDDGRFVHVHIDGPICLTSRYGRLRVAHRGQRSTVSIEAAKDPARPRARSERRGGGPDPKIPDRVGRGTGPERRLPVAHGPLDGPRPRAARRRAADVDRGPVRGAPARVTVMAWRRVARGGRVPRWRVAVPVEPVCAVGSWSRTCGRVAHLHKRTRVTHGQRRRRRAARRPRRPAGRGAAVRRRSGPARSYVAFYGVRCRNS